MSLQSVGNYLAATKPIKVIKYVIDLVISPVWTDSQGVTLDSTCDCPTLCPGGQVSYTGMLDGVRWCFTGEGASEFFIKAENQYRADSAEGCTIDYSYPLILNLAVPADLLNIEDTDELLSSYLDGFEIGVGKMLAVHLQAVGALMSSGTGTNHGARTN